MNMNQCSLNGKKIEGGKGVSERERESQRQIDGYTGVQTHR